MEPAHPPAVKRCFETAVAAHTIALEEVTPNPQAPRPLRAGDETTRDLPTGRPVSPGPDHSGRLPYPGNGRNTRAASDPMNSTQPPASSAYFTLTPENFVEMPAKKSTEAKSTVRST